VGKAWYFAMGSRSADNLGGAGTDPVRLPGPLVVACLAPADLRPEVDPLSGEVRIDPRRADLTAADSAALELALRAGEAWGARVLAVAAGPVSIEGVLRQALAVGAEVLRVADPHGPHGPHGPDGSYGSAGMGPVGGGPVSLGGSDLAGAPEVVAAALATAISRAGRPHLVICGDRSAYAGTGAVPALIAHHLGAGQALGLVSLRFEGEMAVGERRLDGGWRQRLRIIPPAVCSVEAAGIRLRRGSLPSALASAVQPVPTVILGPAQPAAADLRAGSPRPYRPRTRPIPAPAGDARQRILALTGALSAREPPRITGSVDPAAAADELLDYLLRHDYRDREAGAATE
jgi:electron transfer flavoprotein beta subunit